MEMVFREIDVVKTTEAVEARVLGEDEIVSIPAGSVGTVVLVHKMGSRVEAYEVEFCLPGIESALATIPRSGVVAADKK